MTADIITPLVIGFFVLGIIVVGIIMTIKCKPSGQGNVHFQWLADTLELSMTGGEPMFPKIAFLSCIRSPTRVEGERRGCDVSIHHWSTGGKNNTTYSTVRIAVDNPKGLSMRFTREGVLHKLGKGLGLQDVQTGDKHFDRLFMIKCSDPEFIKQALLPEIKTRFFSVWEDHKSQGTITLKNQQLSYDEVGTIRTEPTRARIAAVTDLMCDLGGIVTFYNRA